MRARSNSSACGCAAGYCPLRMSSRLSVRSDVVMHRHFAVSEFERRSRAAVVTMIGAPVSRLSRGIQESVDGHFRINRVDLVGVDEIVRARQVIRAGAVLVREIVEEQNPLAPAIGSNFEPGAIVPKGIGTDIPRAVPIRLRILL